MAIPYRLNYSDIAQYLYICALSSKASEFTNVTDFGKTCQIRTSITCNSVIRREISQEGLKLQARSLSQISSYSIAVWLSTPQCTCRQLNFVPFYPNYMYLCRSIVGWGDRQALSDGLQQCLAILKVVWPKYYYSQNVTKYS